MNLNTSSFTDFPVVCSKVYPGQHQRKGQTSTLLGQYNWNDNRGSSVMIMVEHKSDFELNYILVLINRVIRKQPCIECSECHSPITSTSGIILCMRPANERWLYSVTPCLTGWTPTQNESRIIVSTMYTASEIHGVYRQVSNIRRTKSQHLKDPRTVLRLSLPNPLKPDVKSRMKM